MPRKKSKWQLLKLQDLLDYREKRGFRSDAELAEALEVSVGSIAGWKNGVRAPSMRVQQALVVAMRDSGPSAGVGKPENADLVKRLLSLSAEVKDAAPLVEASMVLLRG